MTAPPEQAEVVAFLRQLAGSEPLETHISLVFVGADTVWKLKKAVRLAFLDFTPLEARRRFTLRELELNRVAAPGLYRDVVPVVRRADGTLGIGDPRRKRGDRLGAAHGARSSSRFPRCGRVGWRAHSGAARRARRCSCSVPWQPVARAETDAVAAMRHVAEGNAQSAHDAGLPDAAVYAWQTRILAALDDIAQWLAHRAHDGFVRRAHGDLHLGNLCLWQGRPVPFDALEFDEAMATIDLGYDLAFLLMDLDQRVARSAANRVLNRYVARTGDAALTVGLPPFLSLRAMVRAHVEAKRGNASVAMRYLAAAAAYLQPTPPVVVAVGGLPGTGKSTLARALAPELGDAPGALVLRSDEIRKRLHAVAPEERLPQSAYSDAASEAVFTELATLVREAAAGGHAVIADATFIDTGHRRTVEIAAREAGVAFVGLWLEAPLAELEARIAGRQRDASDATVAVLRAASETHPDAADWSAIEAVSPGVALSQARDRILLLKAPESA